MWKHPRGTALVQRPTEWSCQTISRLWLLSTVAKIVKATGMFNTEGCTFGDFIKAGNPKSHPHTHKNPDLYIKTKKERRTQFQQWPSTAVQSHNKWQQVWFQWILVHNHWHFYFWFLKFPFTWLARCCYCHLVYTPSEQNASQPTIFHSQR